MLYIPKNLKGGKLDQEEVDRITFQNPIEF